MDDEAVMAGELLEGPSARQVIVAAVSCSQQIVRKIDRALAPEGLTWAQFRALDAIDEQRGWIHAASVARRIGVSRQATSALFARLDARGFLTWLDEERIKSVRLTPAGEQAAARGRSALMHINDAIERLSLEERRGIVSAAESLRRELIRRPSGQPWYVEYLPAHLRREYTAPEW